MAVILTEAQKTAIQAALLAYKQAAVQLVNANDLASVKRTAFDEAFKTLRAATTLPAPTAEEGPILVNRFRIGGKVWIIENGAVREDELPDAT